MPRYAAFLRGVNVGGVTLKMVDVAEVFSAAGGRAVRTVLASGNVVFDADGSPHDLRTTLEAALRSAFDYQAWVLVYPLAQVRVIVADYPWAEVDGRHSYVTFVSDPALLDELLTLGGDEPVARGEGVVYWQAPRSGTLNSAIGKTMGKRRYAAATTTRNLRTLRKVLG